MLQKDQFQHFPYASINLNQPPSPAEGVGATPQTVLRFLAITSESFAIEI